MSLVLDDQAIKDAETLLEFAGKFGPKIYAIVSDALKAEHPKLADAVLPTSEEAAIEKQVEDMIDEKFGSKR